MFRLRERYLAGNIIRLHRHIAAQRCGPRVTRRDHQLRHQGGLLNLPGQRMFTAAATNQQYLHGNFLMSNTFTTAIIRYPLTLPCAVPR